MYVILTYDWRKWSYGGGTRCGEGIGLETRASEVLELVNIKLIWWLIRWTDHTVLCKTKQKLVFR